MRAFTLVRRARDTVQFAAANVFASGGDVATLGHFTDRSAAMDKTVTTPFAIRSEVKDRKVSFMQFMEDTLHSRPLSVLAAVHASEHFHTGRRVPWVTSCLWMQCRPRTPSAAKRVGSAFENMRIGLDAYGLGV